MYFKSNDQQVGELLGELQEKIRSFAEENAKDQTPLQRIFSEWAEK